MDDQDGSPDADAGTLQEMVDDVDELGDGAGSEDFSTLDPSTHPMTIFPLSLQPTLNT